MKALWVPKTAEVQEAEMTRFRQAVSAQGLAQLADDQALYQWSIDQAPAFWESLWHFSDVIGDLDPLTIAPQPGPFHTQHFFKGSFLNYAENLLRPRKTEKTLIFWGEDKVYRTLTFQELCHQVAQCQRLFREAGVTRGDRIAGVLPNMPETVIAMLAAASLGAVWSCCSPDFGAQGIIDRFEQIQPKLLIVCDGYYYKGKAIDLREKTAQVLQGLPQVQRVYSISYLQVETPYPSLTRSYEAYTGQLYFERVPFNHPLFILYSSGTTGMPKCIVHGHGGTLLQHLKEHRLHCNMKPGDRIFYYTTCGWMMWNWLVSALASDVSVVLYDGNPLYPSLERLFEIAEEEQISFMGVSAKFLEGLRQEKVHLKGRYNLKSLRTITSTGSPLAAETFSYVYEAIAPNVHLASISGGTDIISCFLLGYPTQPVYAGYLQGPGLGMAVDVEDEQGHSLTGQRGELVCRQPFPSMPVGFWNDPDHKKFINSYFSRIPNVWCHGDYVEKSNQGYVIYGRSDAVLNPGGVRIGTAEIYRQLQDIEAISDSVVIGQQWKGDVRVVLFVVLKPGHSLTPDLCQTIKTTLKEKASPRHVPEVILEVADIPRTLNGKTTELAVLDTVHGREVKNKEALANPNSLEFFKKRPELCGS
jgi:acetoacetyl-CoA synthetase